MKTVAPLFALALLTGCATNEAKVSQPRPQEHVLPATAAKPSPAVAEHHVPPHKVRKHWWNRPTRTAPGFDVTPPPAQPSVEPTPPPVAVDPEEQGQPVVVAPQEPKLFEDKWEPTPVVTVPVTPKPEPPKRKSFWWRLFHHEN